MAKQATMTGAVKVRGKDDGCCSIFFLKYLIYIFNFILWVSGGAILAVGLWTMFTKTDYISLLTTSVFSATTYLLIGTGGIILLVGFIGCCGAWRESVACLMTYAAFLLLIFLMEAVIGILAYMYEASIEGELTRSLNHTMLHYYKMDDTKTQAIDHMQSEFHCCGAGSFEDWRYSRWLRGNDKLNSSAPDSCCKSPSVMCAISDHPSNINYDGCIVSLQMFLKRHLIIIGSVGLGISCLQIFGIVFACVLAMKVKKWKKHADQHNYWG